MNVKVFSDLHVDSAAVHGYGVDITDEVCKRLNKDDTVVIAGDIAQLGLRGRGGTRGVFDESHFFWKRAVDKIAASCKHLVVVPGNHEFWGTPNGLNLVQDSLNYMRWGRPRNVYVLYRSSVELEGVLFTGATLWGPARGGALLGSNDHEMMQGFVDEMPTENRKDVDFLVEACDRANNAQKKHVVVTHYLPSTRSIHVSWRDATNNDLYVTPLDRFLEDNRGPDFWFHGHTHNKCRYTIGRTEVICNPHGYLNQNVRNGEFDWDCEVKL